MLSSVYCAGIFGIDGYIVTVEADAQPRLPNFELVGLPDAAVKEAKERVRTACLNSGFRFPEMYFMVNLAPADRKKEGSAYDVAILLSIMKSAGIVRGDIDISKKCFVGELSLSGELRPVRGVLSMRLRRQDLRNFTPPQKTQTRRRQLMASRFIPSRICVPSSLISIKPNPYPRSNATEISFSMILIAILTTFPT